MTEITYTCKFCKQQRTFECDLSECPTLQSEAWLKLLACNRCADFERVRLDLIEGAKKYAVALDRARFSMPADKLKTFEEQIAERLTGVTKKYASVICKHRGMPFAWESDFVSQIMEKPENVIRAMEFYYRNISLYTSQQEFVTQ